MELYRQNLKISGRKTGIAWRNEEFSKEFFHYFSQKKRQEIMEKNKKYFFFFICTVHLYSDLSIARWAVDFISLGCILRNVIKHVALTPRNVS